MIDHFNVFTFWEIYYMVGLLVLLRLLLTDAWNHKELASVPTFNLFVGFTLFIQIYPIIVYRDWKRRKPKK